jgi:hypothetical protein
LFSEFALKKETELDDNEINKMEEGEENKSDESEEEEEEEDEEDDDDDEEESTTEDDENKSIKNKSLESPNISLNDSNSIDTNQENQENQENHSKIKVEPPTTTQNGIENNNEKIVSNKVQSICSTLIESKNKMKDQCLIDLNNSVDDLIILV